ncbi:unnamed protein product, partial [Fusarium fujikuroi]
AVAYRIMVAKKARTELEKQLKNDDRDVADLWKEALKSYESIVGFGLQRKFDNVQSMLDYGTDQMNNFHKFRHDKGKVDRLRTLFSSNLDLVEQGANQIIAAAAPAFPPAAAIGTALTYMLQACRSVSADYDIVIVFFEDMNSFLGRITILEKRLPQDKAYQNCLMEVFTSLLTMCGFAHKYIELGRFKKWISNLFKGDDGELGGARANMNKNLDHLQQATEFAILGNTEETLAMASQLDENQKSHAEMLERVGHTIDTIHENTENIRGDIAKILKLFGGQKKEKAMEKPQANKPTSSNSIRNAMPIVFNDDHEYHALKETLLPDSCSWLFSEPEWEEWLKLPDGTRPILAVASEPGTGKSHMAAALHDKLAQRASEDETGHTCVAHFYFREQEDAFAFLLCGVITVINRIAETNYAACEKLNAQIARDDLDIDTKLWQNLVEHLLGAVFAPDSKFNLFIVLDGLDELRDWANFKLFLTDYFNGKGLKISLVVTSRPEKLDDLPEGTKVTRIEATKKKQIQDLRALVWSEINALNNLRRFSRYVQQRIADNIEEASPNMLYAQHLLGRLDDLGREGAVLRALSQDKPKTLHGIYEILLAECQRRMPPKHQEVAAALLHWVAFSKRLLTLAEVQSLVKYLAQDNEFDIEEIRELFDKFLRIGGPGYDTEVLARLQASQATAVQDLKQDDDDKHDSIYDDGPLPVTFKERSMRHYFTNSTHGASDFRWGPSEANRKMFVTSAALLKQPREAVCEGLLKYAALWFISHFTSMDMNQHTPEEQVEQAIQSLLHDCFAGLNDSVGWNDAPYLWMLAQSLSLMSKALRNDAELDRCARIVASAVFSRLGNTDKAEDDDASAEEEAQDQGEITAEEENDEPPADVDTSDDEEDIAEPPTDEGDLVDPEDGYYTCGGFCNPARKFKWWAGRSAYLYITFASGMICEECQAEYDAIERGEKKFKGRYFYGLGQDKLKLPVEGWRGVKNGVMRIEGQEDVAVDDFFKKLETEVVRNAWDRIWAGDGF